jgi:hypothetical protein
MAGGDNWQNEPRDERGRWTSSDDGAAANTTPLPPIDVVNTALSGQPLAAHDRLDATVTSFGRNFLSDVGAALPTGKADGVGVLADTLNQVSINGKGSFGSANSDMIAGLRAVAAGLQTAQSTQTREAAATKLRDILNRPELADQLGQAMHEVELIKQTNIKELARVMENEAGSDTDKPIKEAFGHTVVNRMRRNETAQVPDVSGQYSHGQTPPSSETRNLAIKLLNGQLPDNTGGATHFYQPIEMAHPNPVPQDDKGQYQTGSAPKGYEYVPGVTVKDAKGSDVLAFSVRPDWANGMQQVPVKGVPDSLAKFFVAPGSRHVR